MSDVHFNPLVDGYFEDPYSQYAQLRDTDPVHRSPFGGWMLFRHDDTFEWLRRPDTSVADDRSEVTDRRKALIAAGAEDQLVQARSLLFIDPPDHTRLRRLVSRTFTPRTVENLRPRVQQLVDEALDEIEKDGGADLMQTLAFTVPFVVISEMLGMPQGNRDELRSWSTTGGRALEPVLSDEMAVEIVSAMANMQGHIREVVRDKRKNPDDHLLSALIAAEDDGDMLGDDELIALVALIYIAGHETTVNLIGNGTLALLKNRDQLDKWRNDPTLDANTVDELLRYDSPVQFTRRIAVNDLTIDGHDVRAKDFVLTALGSCNRDPQQWGDNADSLDLARAEAGRHLSFGSGIHFCLGAALARMEGQIALGSLVRRFPNIDLAGETTFRPQIVLRGLNALPVSV